jgi:hypothetical protein
VCVIETCTVFHTASYNENFLHCYSSLTGPQLIAAGVMPAWRIRTSAILLLERTGSYNFGQWGDLVWHDFFNSESMLTSQAGPLSSLYEGLWGKKTVKCLVNQHFVAVLGGQKMYIAFQQVHLCVK